MTDLAYNPTALIARVRADLVGMVSQAEVLAVALATGRHVVMEGPPGTGKSTLLRALASEAGVPLVFVEGNAELTPSRLVGHHDPAMVLQGGYTPDAFVPGPLVDAVRDGGLLYLEELNRIPEESLNVLITALAEGELHVPRVGRIPAAPSFRLIAAMNPYDAIGTGRIGQAIYDRMCRVSVTYQDEISERRIVARVTGIAFEQPDVELAVSMVRATRSHADVRVGSSVRGAIDMALLVDGLRDLRHVDPDSTYTDQRPVLLDSALAALSGRIRLDEACDRQPEEVITEILDAAIADWMRRHQSGAESESAQEGDSGKGDGPAPQGPPQSGPGRGRILSGDDARAAVAEAARRTHGRYELAKHQAFGDVSPQVGELDAAALEELVGSAPDEAAALIADLANATDRLLRAKARRAAAQLFVRMARQQGTPRQGVRRLKAVHDALDGEVDVDATLARTDGLRPMTMDDVVVRRWGANERAICLLVDRSGSMNGRQVAIAALAAASVMVSAGERADCSVLAFNRDVVVLQEQGHRRPVSALLDDILSLRGKGETDLALALRAARRQLGTAVSRERVAVLLSDAKRTTGDDPLVALRGLDRLHVLGTSDEAEAEEHGRLLARRGGGRYLTCTSVLSIPRALTMLLND